MSSFIDLLRRFNRKERFYLVGWALGRPSFQLGETFRENLANKLKLPVPENAFVAMDYHLNWIYAAALLSAPGALPWESAVLPNPIDATSGRRLVEGNQEDIDLVVAFEQGGIAHLVLVEAKGVIGWSNKQLKSKAARLMAIFGDRGGEEKNPFGHVKPYFVIVSPRESRALLPEEWPSWMRGENVAWLELTVPDNLLAVTRCDQDGKATQFGENWRVKREKPFRVAAADASLEPEMEG